MKVLLVIDSISDLHTKIDMLKNRFGNNILYIVKSNLYPIVKTYNIPTNAIYKNNLVRIIHNILPTENNEDTVICYSSLQLDNVILNRFIEKIGTKEKIVNIMPYYNAWENACNATYNIYVKTLFKTKDSTISPKLQFLPASFVDELINSHFGNRLFEIDEKYTTTLYLDKGEQNNSFKNKIRFSKFHLIPIIAALLITIGLFVSLAFIKVNYLLVISFVLLYALDIVMLIIFQSKVKFDQRFIN